MLIFSSALQKIWLSAKQPGVVPHSSEKYECLVRNSVEGGESPANQSLVDEYWQTPIILPQVDRSERRRCLCIHPFSLWTALDSSQCFQACEVKMHVLRQIILGSD